MNAEHPTFNIQHRMEELGGEKEKTFSVQMMEEE